MFGVMWPVRRLTGMRFLRVWTISDFVALLLEAGRGSVWKPICDAV